MTDHTHLSPDVIHDAQDCCQSLADWMEDALQTWEPTTVKAAIRLMAIVPWEKDMQKRDEDGL